MGIQNDRDTLEDSLSISYQVNGHLPSNPTHAYLPLRNEMYFHKKICTQLYMVALLNIQPKKKTI